MRDEERRAELQAGIRQYHAVSLDQVLSEVRYLRDDGDSVIAGGSLAYGLGNHLSDLDLLVAGSTTTHSSRVPLEHFVDSLRVDVWKLAQAVIEETFDRAERALAGEAPLQETFGDFDHETDPKLLHRIAFGVLLDGDGFGPASGRDYASLASDLVVREYVERMRSSTLLAQLALRAKRGMAAVFNARRAVEEALNASVASRGLPFSGDKWLIERLGGQAADLARIHRPFRQLPGDPTADADQFVEGAVAACSALWNLDLSIETLAPQASWRNADLRLFEVGNDRLLLSTKFNALRQLGQEEAEAWTQLTTAAKRDGSMEAWSMELDDQRTQALSFVLHEQGLLNLGWARGITIDDLSGAGAREMQA